MLLRGFLFIGLTALCCFCFGQAEDIAPSEEGSYRRGYLGMSFGAAFPIGNFKETDIALGNVGFAETGTSANFLNGGYYFDRAFGAAVVWHSNSNGFNEQALGQALSRRANDTTFNVSNGDWKYSAFMVGALIAFPKSSEDDVAVELRMLLGYSSASYPATTFELNSNNSVERIQQATESSGAVAAQLGLGLRIHLNDYLNLNVNGDFFTTKHRFDLELVNEQGNIIEDIQEQPIDALLLTAGISVALH